MPAQFIQRRLEIIQDHSICEALEDKAELPERVDYPDGQDRCDREEVDDDEDNAEQHAEEQDTESWRYADNVDESEFVSVTDVPEEVGSRENPPWITIA